MPVSGMIVCLLFAFMGGDMHKTFGEIRSFLEFDDRNIAKLDQGLASGEIDMETYSKTTLLMAKERFMKDGSIIEYTAPDGQKVLYEPNEPERESYMEMQCARDFFGNLQKSCLWSVYLWVGVALLSTILGLVTPIKSVAC